MTGAVQLNHTVAANGDAPQDSSSPVCDVAPVLFTVAGTPVEIDCASARSSSAGRGLPLAVTVTEPAVAQLSVPIVQSCGSTRPPTWTRYVLPRSVPTVALDLFVPPKLSLQTVCTEPS